MEEKKEKKQLKNGKMYRLWVTFPNKEILDFIKNKLTEDFGSSGLGLYALSIIYSNPDRAINLGNVSHVFDILKNANANTKDVYKLKREIEELKSYIKDHKKGNIQIEEKKEDEKKETYEDY